ncbi:hypothetical protein ISS42_01230 [Candidatus Shapirobacteria bacterium]|nr:hypothetical protein [Candidatus Shapirobacteria bacterium]
MVDIYKAKKEEPKAVGQKKKDERSAKLKEVRKEVYRLVGKNNNFFSSFVAQPQRLSFENQMIKEKVILLLRRHWVTNLRWVGLVFLMSIAPLFLRALPPFDWLPFQFRLVLILMWYLFVLAFTLEEFFSWFFSVNIITDERIVDIDFISLIYKRVSDAEIVNIEDVTYKMGGVMGTMLDYGTIYVQTAAEIREFEFESVPHPALVAKVLQRLRLEEKQEELEGRLN